MNEILKYIGIPSEIELEGWEDEEGITTKNIVINPFNLYKSTVDEYEVGREEVSKIIEELEKELGIDEYNYLWETFVSSSNTPNLVLYWITRKITERRHAGGLWDEVYPKLDEEEYEQAKKLINEGLKRALIDEIATTLRLSNRDKLKILSQFLQLENSDITSNFLSVYISEISSDE